MREEAVYHESLIYCDEEKVCPIQLSPRDQHRKLISKILPSKMTCVKFLRLHPGVSCRDTLNFENRIKGNLTTKHTSCMLCSSLLLLRLMSVTVSHRVLPPDLGHSGERSVGRHDGEREAAALVPADGGGIPGPALRQLHHQLEGWQTLQRHHTQTQVRPMLEPGTKTSGGLSQTMWFKEKGPHGDLFFQTTQNYFLVQKACLDLELKITYS